ncbi:uncharacterized mitochondrial protein-like protein [Tanacetum coccineum]
MVSRAVLMKSSFVSVNITRQVNTAHTKTTVNTARLKSYLSKKAHLTFKRPIHKNTTFKNSNFNQRVNTVKDKNVNTVRPKAVVNVVKGNNVNVVKALACWVWKPKTKVLDHGNPQMDLQDQGVIDSGCSRHMTGNMSYLTNYEEIDGGYVAFGGNPKGGKITRKGTQSNDFIGTKASDNACQTRKETELVKDYILLPLWTADPPFSQDPKSSHDDGSKPSSDDENKVNVVIGKTSIELPFDPNMPALEDYSIFDSSRDDEVKANMHNLDTTIQNDKQAAQTRRMSKILENSTKEGIDYVEVFAPVARIEAIWLFLAYASFKDFMVYQMDVKSAFLYGKIEEEVYVCQPPGFEYPDFPDRVYKFQRGKINKTLLIKRYKGDILLVQVYVDDIIFGSTKKELCNAFENLMHDKFQIRSIGELTFFLGLQVEQNKDGIFISQDKYVGEILKKFGFTKVKIASTPIETQKPLLKDENGEEVDVHMYKSMIGSLMYLTSSRLDIMFVLKRLPKLGFWYPKDSPFDLVAYTDSDYAGASLDRKSTTGGKAKKSVRLMMEELCKNRQSDLVRKRIERVGINLLLLVKVNAARPKLTATVQLQALVDGKKIIITESTVRRDLQLEDAEGVDCLPNTTIFEQLALMGNDPKTTAWNEFSSTMASAIICLATNQKFNFSKFIFESMVKNLGNVGKFLMYPRFENVSKLSNDLLLARGNTLQSGEDSLKLNELMELCTNLQQKVLDLETTNTTQANEITSLKRRVKKLEKKDRSRTYKLKILYKVGLSARVESFGDEEDLGKDASKQGKRIHDIDADEDITLVNDDNEIFNVDALAGEEVFVAEQSGNVVEEVVVVIDATSTIPVSAATITDVEITLAQALAELKSAKPKADKVVIQEPEQGTTTTTPTTIIPVPKPPQDKGKGIMIEEPVVEQVKPMKRLEQMRLDEELAFKLQAEEEEDQERLAREKAQQIKEANIAWDDVQAKVEADYQLAQRLQAQEQEELTDEEKARLFVQFLEQRRKHFAAKRAEEKRNRPPTRAQQRNIMCTYLKNMEGWKPKSLKNKSFANIQELFEKEMKRVNTFVDYMTELVEEGSKKAETELEENLKKPEEEVMEGSSKRAGTEMEQEVNKKKKVDEDKETTKLQSLIEVIPDEEEVAIDDVPLATKPPTIVDWKIHKEGKKSYYQILEWMEINAARSSYRYYLAQKIMTAERDSTAEKGIKIKEMIKIVCRTRLLTGIKEFHCEIIPSPTWDKSKLHDHLKPWADVLLTNVFVEIEAKEELPIVVGYMLFCIETHTPFNFAYFLAKRMDGLEFNKDPIPYARVITTLVEYIKNEHPNDTSRVMEVDDVSPMWVPFTMDSIEF